MTNVNMNTCRWSHWVDNTYDATKKNWKWYVWRLGKVYWEGYRHFWWLKPSYNKVFRGQFAEELKIYLFARAYTLEGPLWTSA